jgi:hypothetical protein
MELQVPVSECIQVSMPRFDDLDTPAADAPVVGALERLIAWYRALQRTLDDPRPLRCERVWLHPRDHEQLEAWASEGIAQASADADAWSTEWLLSGPSYSGEVPEGKVLIEPGAWEPPRHVQARDGGGETPPR